MVLAAIPRRIVACSGGVDSMLLATLAHRADPNGTVIAHDVTPAVPEAATDRVRAHAATEGWELELVHSDEFGDEDYLSNPRNRCFHCKRHLYGELADLSARLPRCAGWTVLSGANLDDLGEYRPGLDAAAQRGVRHPFIEAAMGKAEIRATARTLGLAFADLPASPCLASRLYTGTRVTPGRLRAVELGEQRVRALTAVNVVRCRVREGSVLIEVSDDDRRHISAAVIDEVAATMRSVEPSLATVLLDADPYRPGRAFTAAR
jgi:uncharacterized protein